MYKLKEHSITHSHMGNDYESITEVWHIYDPDQFGKYTIITQRRAIGKHAASWRTYWRQGMKTWDDDTKNKVKKEIIQEVKDWFDKTSFDWLDIETLDLE
jgi:hypothetical protein